MRGDNSIIPDEEIVRKDVIIKSKMASAYVIDKDGNVVYHLVSAWWFNTIMALVILMIFAILIIAVLAFYNGQKINEIMSTPTVREEIKETR